MSSTPGYLDQHYMMVPRLDPRLDQPMQLPCSAPSVAASSLPPSRAALSALTHVPASLFSATQKRVKGSQKNTGRIPGIRDGKTVSKMFNPVASRPYPALTPLEREIQVTMANSTTFLTTSTSVPSYASTSFQLSLFPDAGQYTGVFDQYRIDQIEVWLESLNNSPASNTISFASCVDLDDANTPTAYADISERQGALIGTTLSGHYHRWKPHVAVAEYAGAFTAFGNSPAGWIDVASPSVQHYALKCATVGVDGVARPIQLSYRVLVSFRGSAI